ncbi:MAG: barrel protein, endonuclease family 2/xylose isomerase-like family [Deltaproteobacteria bacterium]|nr:barrel protein, endonuclease family 2/xylose isomerase-like family [Deltaproteobacteria bacterium]
MSWIIHSTVPYPLLGEEETVRRLAESGVGPEIYFSAPTLDALSPEEAGRTAETLRAAGIRSLSFHAPFRDIWPGAQDEEARRLSVRRLAQAIALAPVFRPRGVVMHGGYFGWLFDFRADEWLESARRSFGELAEAAEKADTQLFVENVFDEAPDHLLRLREAVGSPRLGFCFDPGHANLFSAVPLHRWAEAFGEGMRLMHVHDNRGQRDDHLPVGEGTINFRGVLLAATDAGARPILTVEPHRREHFARSVAGLRAILSALN